MRFRSFLLSLSLPIAISASSAWACDAGPDYCSDDPRVPDMLAQKKARLLQDFPANFVALLDIGVQCVARIRTSPDAFSLMIVGTDGTILISTWDADNQRVANGQISSGAVKEYWIIHSRHAFSCAGEPDFQNRSDYDTTLDLNTSFALRCDTADRCSVE